MAGKDDNAGAAGKAATKVYKAISNILLDGEWTMAGEKLELTAEQAKELADLGAIETK